MQVTDILVLHKGFIFPAAFIITALLLFSCGELNQQETERVNEALNDSLTSTTETWNLDMELIEEGQKKIQLKGTYSASFNTKKINETRIRGPVNVLVYDSLAAVKTWVDADSAIYRADTSEFELFGDVKVRTRDKRRLASEYLKWEHSKNSISTPEFVIITTPTDSIAGTGFNGASELSSYTIKQPSGRVIF